MSEEPTEPLDVQSKRDRRRGGVVVAAIALGFALPALALRAQPAWLEHAARFAEPSADCALQLDAHLAHLGRERPGAALLLGNSMTRDALTPRRLRLLLGGRDGGLAPLVFPGGPAYELAMALPQIEDAKAERWIVGASASALIHEVDWSRVRFYAPAYAAEVFGIGSLVRDADEHLDRALWQLHPVIHHRRGLRRGLLGRRLDPTSRPPEGRAAGVFESPLASLSPGGFSCDAPGLRALRVIAERAGANDVRLDLVLLPHRHPSEAARAAQTALPACVATALEGTGAHVHDAIGIRPWRDGDFRDASHLTSRGREALLRWLVPRLGGDHAL